ncbi:hypothetical protein [Brevundimonas sp. NIBR11]|uniref:hypothetical protein n=1 Tax=Brevundimonas sp. NIBR11 TaxID=3015999 RepID=UPI0022F05D2F|nr:hypothetical protein [Brevundimonas sp. NIBR11]WGM30535.1 hypothetical protein KKHFBJBL_00760 [Brevundimonas sp. NIBR11]
MRFLRPALFAFALLASPVVAQAPATAPVPVAAEPLQFYVFSFTDTPVAEAAQDVVGGALAYELTVDPAVDGGIVSFRADGWYSSDALLKDFGAALLDQDIALMRTGAGAYAVVPRANVPMLMARGGTLMTLAEPVTARPPVPAAVAAATAVYGKHRWWDGAFAGLLLFFGGALAGAAALFGGQTVYRRAEARARIAPPVLRITDQRQPVARPPEGAEADPELVIPTFDERRS